MKLPLIIVLLSCSFSLSAQTTFPAETIAGDSIRLFFNEAGYFVQKTCAEYVRYVRLNESNQFDGRFLDTGINSSETVTRGSGAYVAGSKEGEFEAYHKNGKLFFKGAYKNNIPTGRWKYFHKSGLPERTLSIDSTGVRIIEMSDEKGNVLIENGNGKFEGFVAGNWGNLETIRASGEIKNGVPQGSWTSRHIGLNTVYCNEEFENGKFIKGVFPATAHRKKSTYTDRSFLNTFLLPTYLDHIDEFRLERCSEEPAQYELKEFRAQLKRSVEQIVSTDVREGRTADYGIGEHIITIKFTTDENGNPKDFAPVSAWGQQFYSTITSALAHHAKFRQRTDTWYLHLKMNFTNGYTYSYSYIFSFNSQPRF